MRCPLVPLVLVALSAGCARAAAPPAAPVWTPPPPALTSAPTPEPLSWTPRPAAYAAPRSNLMAAPAPSAPAADIAVAEQAPPTPAVPEAQSVQPPAKELAALEQMLRHAPPPPTVHRSSAQIPDGSACLEMLDGFHLPYSRLEAVKGIKTPISVRGPIGGVRYRSWGKRPLVADCRFVVALEWIAPVLQQIGVTEVRYIGTYSYRMARVGRLSLHAYGLAIDIEGMVADGTMHEVSKAFTRGMGKAACSPAAPLLDQVACRVKAMGLFREVLTPDSNADHANHFHFGILPVGVTLAMLPRYLPGHRRHHHDHGQASKLADRTAPKKDDATHTSAKLAKADASEPERDGRSRHDKRSAKDDKRSAKDDKRSAKDDEHTPPGPKHLARTGRHSGKTEKPAPTHHKRLAQSAKHSRTHHKASAPRHQRSAPHQKKVAKDSHPRSAPHQKKVAKDNHAHGATHHEQRTAKAESHPKHGAKPARRPSRHDHDSKADHRIASRAEKPETEHHHADTRPRTAERHHHHGRSRKTDKH